MLRPIESARAKATAAQATPLGGATPSSAVQAVPATLQSASVVTTSVFDGQARPVRVSGIFEASSGPSLVTRLVKLPLWRFASWVTARLQRKITYATQVNAAPWVAGMKPNQVFLWMPVHQTSLDHINLLPLRSALPHPIDLRIFSRKLENKWAQLAYGSVLGSFIATLNRTNSEGMSKADREKLSPAERAALEAKLAKAREENEARFDEVRRGFGRATHAAMFVEGTTMTPGRIVRPKVGAYFLVRIAQPDGSIKVVPAVPFGNTTDMLAAPWGSQKRYLNFVNVGEPVIYEPVAPRPSESQEDFERRDARAYMDKVHDAFIRLTTITTSQLIGVRSLELVAGGDAPVKKSELLDYVADKVRLLAMLGYATDDALATEGGRRERVDAAWANLVRLGFIKETAPGQGSLVRSRVTHNPVDSRFNPEENRHYRGFKDKNPLLYSANRLVQLSEHDPRVSAALSGGDALH